MLFAAVYIGGVASKNQTPRLDRAQVVDTALRLLNEVGLDRLSLRLIAGELEVKAPALYWHFRDKRELLDEMATEMYRRMTAGATNRRDPPPGTGAGGSPRPRAGCARACSPGATGPASSRAPASPATSTAPAWRPSSRPSTAAGFTLA
ncbi:transcriptional regulator, TetR family, partial [Streptomyces sp. SolWspMP-sol7th]